MQSPCSRAGLAVDRKWWWYASRRPICTIQEHLGWLIEVESYPLVLLHGCFRRSGYQDWLESLLNRSVSFISYHRGHWCKRSSSASSWVLTRWHIEYGASKVVLFPKGCHPTAILATMPTIFDCWVRGKPSTWPMLRRRWLGIDKQSNFRRHVFAHAISSYHSFTQESSQIYHL